MKTNVYLATLAPLGLLAAGALHGQGQPPMTCAGKPTCAESSSFVAAITDFRATLQNTNNKLVTIRLSFRNKLNRPLILGYVQGSGIATDDRGNRYVVYGHQSVRGIGEIAGNTVDPKFILQPGEASESRFEYVWRSSGTEIFGLTFEVDLTVREIESYPGNQFRLGREHALHFGPGLGRLAAQAPAAPPASGSAPPRNGSHPPAAPAAPAPAPSASAAPDPAVDACAGKPRCYSAGPFAAEITSLTPSKTGAYHVLQAGIRFRNLTNQPLVLAYTALSAVITDNLGNRYGPSHRNDPSAQGIGTVHPGRADPQFVLQPGQSGVATWKLQRYMYANSGMGSSYTLDLTISHLEVLQSQQIRTVRDYPINFPDLAAAGPGLPQSTEGVGEAAKKLRDIFRRRK